MLSFETTYFSRAYHIKEVCVRNSSCRRKVRGHVYRTQHTRHRLYRKHSRLGIVNLFSSPCIPDLGQSLYFQVPAYQTKVSLRFKFVNLL